MQNNGIQIRVSDLLFTLQKRWGIIVSLTVVGLVFGLVLSGMAYVQASFQSFEVKGSFAIAAVAEDGRFASGNYVPTSNDVRLAEDMTDSVQYVIRSPRVLNEVINNQEILGTTPTQLRNAITLSRYNETQILEMKVSWNNADEGIAIWYEIVQQANMVLPETLVVGSLMPINLPEATVVGSEGSGGNIWMFMTILGFAAGIGYAVMGLLMHPTLNNVRDVETMLGLETVGVIPRDNAYFRKRTSLLVQEDDRSSNIYESYSAAAYILRNRLGTGDKHHCFFITSSTRGEGKSTVAANIAIQLSDMEHRTLLIDFDTRNPTIGSLFLSEVDYAHSLNALYRGEATEAEAVTTLTGYLDLLPTVLEHMAIPMDNNIVDMIRRLSEQYEYVIIDSAPVGVASDALSLNQVADSALFVVGFDKASIPEIQNSLDRLEKAGVRLLGCVVNSVQSGVSSGRDERRESAERRKRRKKDNLFAEEEAGTDNNPVEDLLLKKDPSDAGAGSGSRNKKASKAKTSEKQEKERPVYRANKNVMEDLMREGSSAEAMSDQEAADALYQLGFASDDRKDEPDEGEKTGGDHA